MGAVYYDMLGFKEEISLPTVDIGDSNMVTSPGPSPEAAKPVDFQALLLKAFTPHAPISLPDFLLGRSTLIYRMTDAVNTEGLHAVLYGDRGTGKTSIARVVAFLVQETERAMGRRCILVSCTVDDTFASIWRKIGQGILLTQRQLGFFQAETKAIISGHLDLDSTVTTPSDARIFLEALANPLVVVIDEFDRIRDEDTRALMADTIKYFSDHGVRTTLILVGVGKSLSDLLKEHLSISRNIAQIPVEPMSMSELAQIIQKGYEYTGLQFEDGLNTEMAKLSQGYPHYTHLLGLWSGRRALEGKRTLVTFDDLNNAVPDVLQNAEGGLQLQYELATNSTNPTAIFKQVLLACAMAKKDSLGRFAVGAVQDPLELITGTEYTTGAYQAHLGRFCEDSRGPVLERSGEPKSYRWRFLNPQLIPYVVLQGVRSKMIQASRVTPRQRV